MIQAKKDARYRAQTTDYIRCEICIHYIPRLTAVGIGNNIDLGPRCRLIGIEPEEAYRVRPNAICRHFSERK